MNSVLEKLYKDIENLNVNEQLELLEKIIHNIKKTNTENKHYLDWNELYGTGKGIWNEDAQDYINELREDR